MTRLGLSVLLVACGAGFAACSGTSNAPDAGVDASVDAGLDVSVPDTGADAEACIVGDGPASLPFATATFVVEGSTPPDAGTPDASPPDAGLSDAGDAGDAGDADAGDAGLLPFAARAPLGDLPEPTGGDETGMWAYEKITVYLPPPLASIVDVSKSGGAGKGWVELSGSTYRQSADFTLLVTAYNQSIPAPLKIDAKGTYTKSGADLLLAPTCSEGAPATDSTYSFSRLSPTKLQLRSTMALQGVTLSIVIDLTKK